MQWHHNIIVVSYIVLLSMPRLDRVFVASFLQLAVSSEWEVFSECLASQPKVSKKKLSESGTGFCSTEVWVPEQVGPEIWEVEQMGGEALDSVKVDGKIWILEELEAEEESSLVYLFELWCQLNHWQPTVSEPATVVWMWSWVVFLGEVWSVSATGVILDPLRPLRDCLKLMLKQVTVPLMLSRFCLALTSGHSSGFCCVSGCGSIGPPSVLSCPALPCHSYCKDTGTEGRWSCSNSCRVSSSCWLTSWHLSQVMFHTFSPQGLCRKQAWVFASWKSSGENWLSFSWHPWRATHFSWWFMHCSLSCSNCWEQPTATSVACQCEKDIHWLNCMTTTTMSTY